ATRARVEQVDQQRGQGRLARQKADDAIVGRRAEQLVERPQRAAQVGVAELDRAVVGGHQDGRRVRTDRAPAALERVRLALVEGRACLFEVPEVPRGDLDVGLRRVAEDE